MTHVEDRLHEILIASEEHKLVDAGSARPQFSLISYCTLSVGAEPSIRRFQEWVRQIYGVSIRAVAGGYGCTRIEFDVVAECVEQAVAFARAMIVDARLHEKAQEIGFRVLITEAPYTRVDLKSGQVEGADALQALTNQGGISVTTDRRDQSTHINVNAPVTNSTFATHSPNATQTATDSSSLESILIAIQEKAETDEGISKKQYHQVLEQLDALRKEMGKPKPSMSIAERLVGDLGGVASLASLAMQIPPLLPTIIRP